jgi:ribonuclease HI
MDACTKLSDCVGNWVKIGASDTICNWITRGVQLPFIQSPVAFDLPNHKFDTEYKTFINDKITELQSCGAIKQVYAKPLCISPLGCVPKKAGGLRLIHDLRLLNRYIDPPKFINEGIDTVIDLVQSKDEIITVDLKNGFHHVPICVDHQQYLGFRWGNKYYTWAVLPFGLNASPYFFYKVLRPVISYLRQQGLRVSLWVDDFILFSNTSKIQEHKKLFIDTLHELGWRINLEKSVLIPKREANYIGYVIATDVAEYPIIRIPKSRIRKLKKDIGRALAQTQIKVRVLARILGQCISMTKAVLPGKLLLRNSYRDLATKKSWDDFLVLSQPCRADLEWWSHAIDQWNGQILFPSQVDTQVYTDASGSGWGAYFEDKEAFGVWTEAMTHTSINYRELMAVMCAVKSFRHLLKNRNVQILSDNITTVAYLNHLGGPSPSLTKLMTSIWMEAHEAGIRLSARHLAGVQNTHADRLSRLPTQYEWMLNPRIFQYLDSIWGPHHVDRFATMANAQLPIYNSYRHDPLTSGVDALAQDWANTNNFCNPPWRLMNRVLNKVCQSRSMATVIAPMWPQQPWYQKLCRMSVSSPIPIPNCPMSFLHHFPVPEPRRNWKWKIYAWRICGWTN